MICKEDLFRFFDLEAEASKKRWEALMKLPLKERIRKRKAIANVYIDKGFPKENTPDGYILIRVKVGVNLSDFKEGECLILRKEGEHEGGFCCHLERMEGDDVLYLGVFPPNMPTDPLMEIFYDTPLVLDCDAIDLRRYVYNPFLEELPPANNEFWENMLLNKKGTPTFENQAYCKEKLRETLSNYDITLLPKQYEAVEKCMSAKDYYLIQGPPGTGKSFVLGLIMFEELIDLHHNVIVIGPNHLAINNAMEQLLKIEPRLYQLYTKVGQSYNAPTLKIKSKDTECAIKNVAYFNVEWARNLTSKYDLNWLVGLTPHALYTRRARGLSCDTLVIDEAGQMPIPLALMGMIKAKKVILAGDHKQLPPILSSDEIAGDLKKSVFQHLISTDNCTMLDVSFRMCKPICDFVSELFYDGMLQAKCPTCGDRVTCSDPLFSFHVPVVIRHIEDHGEQTSDKEAEFISETIASFLNKGVPAGEIAVLSPFRAQAANIRRHLRRHAGLPEDVASAVTSDTVDKMQGQEREVIIFSLTAGNPDYMTEMAEFLYKPNKMNVAFSRAKFKLIIVGNIEEIRKMNLEEFSYLKRMLESKYAKVME